MTVPDVGIEMLEDELHEVAESQGGGARNPTQSAVERDVRVWMEPCPGEFVLGRAQGIEVETDDASEHNICYSTIIVEIKQLGRIKPLRPHQNLPVTPSQRTPAIPR